LALKPGIDSPRLGFRNARPLGIPFSFDVDAVVDFRRPRPALVAQRHEVAFHINHLGRYLLALDGLLWKGRRVAPDKIDEVEAGQPFHEVAPNFPLGTFDRLLRQESTRLAFADPGIIL